MPYNIKTYKQLTYTTTEFGRIPSNWNYEILDNFLELITYGFTNPMPTTTDGPFMVTAKDVKDSKINYDTARHTSNDAFKLLTDKSKPFLNDVLITKDGSIGRVAIVDTKDVCINQSVALLRPNKRIKARFLKYILESPVYQNMIDRDTSGSTIKHIYITRINKMLIGVPGLKEQDSILNILSAIDDKIELNLQMNKTLEEMAMVLYKHWFIDFGPFQGGEFVDSELGIIPKGWKVNRLEEITIELRRGISPSYTEDDGIRVINQRCIRNHTIDFAFSRKNDLNKKKVDGRVLQLGDVLVNSTGVGTLGRMAPVIELVEDTVVDSHVTVIRVNPEIFKINTFARLMISIEPIIEEMGEGSTGQTELSRVGLSEFKVLVAPLEIQEYLEKHLEQYSNMIANNINENQTLTTLRDTLLPKLISGEVRVKEAVEILD